MIGLLTSPLAWALGLGDIDVRSKLGQRFDAHIPVLASGGDELANLQVRVAGLDDYARAGLERDLTLSTLTIMVQKEGAPSVAIRSENPMREPYLQLLLEVSGGGQRLIRQYTILLDPPGGTQAARAPAPAPAPTTSIVPAPAPAPAAAPRPSEAAVVPAPSAARPLPVDRETFFETPEEAGQSRPRAGHVAVDAPPAAVAPAAPARPAPVAPRPASRAVPPPPPEPRIASAGADAERGLYGPVRRGETLWSIGAKLRAPRVSTDQSVLALYRANPRAFDGGINGLLSGSMLRVPTADEMRSLDMAEAQRQVRRLLRGESLAEPAQDRAEATSRPESEIDTALAEAAVAPTATEAPAAEKPAGPIAEAEPAAAPTDVQAEAAEEASAAPPPEDAVPASEPATPEQAAADASAPTPADADEVLPPGATLGGDTQTFSLIERYLIPAILGLLVLSGVLWLISLIRRRRGAAVPAPARPSSPPKPKVAQAAQAVAASAAPAVEPEPPPAASVPAQAPDAAAEPAAANIDEVLSEADFNLAYGLNEEAIPLLKRVLVAQPGRGDVISKLAKALHATGRLNEFDELVEQAHDELSEGQREELLAVRFPKEEPSAPTGFEVTQAVSAAPSAVADPWADEEPPPATPAPAQDTALVNEAEPAAEAAPAPLPESPQPEPTEPPPAAAADTAMEFKIEDFELPSQAANPSIAQDQPKAEAPASVEFDLSGFDVDSPATPPAPKPAPAKDDGNALEFDLGPFDPAAQLPAGDASTPLGDAEMQLDDFDFDGGGEPESGDISQDDAGTKLDLARAYIEMGDQEMARGLLGEVLQQGNEGQKRDAQSLLNRLS